MFETLIILTYEVLLVLFRYDPWEPIYVITGNPLKLNVCKGIYILITTIIIVITDGEEITVDTIDEFDEMYRMRVLLW